MNSSLNYIDLFAGAGGLSEGFMRAGYNPVAHVEMDEAACFTLKTRISYYHLKETDALQHYESYLRGDIDRQRLYGHIPKEKLESVINLTISDENNTQIFDDIDNKLNGQKVHLLIGGPPCQAYSLVGRARDKDKMQKDTRNYLFRQYANYLERYKPDIFVFENVPGLKSAGNGSYFQSMKELFDEKGYRVKDVLFEAQKFGVLQKRKRIILLGHTKELNIDLTDFTPEWTNSYIVNSIFEDLPELQAGEGIDKFTNYTKETNSYLAENHIRNGLDFVTQHICRPHRKQDKEIYRIAVQLWNDKKERLNYNNLPDHLKTHINRTSFFDRFKVVTKDANASHTVVAHICKDGHYYIHPDINQNRSLSVREAARLQSFPDDFFFEGVKEGHNRTAAFKQIGNAVPPLVAEVIAKKIKQTFLNIK